VFKEGDLSITAGLWWSCATSSTKPINEKCSANHLTCSGVPKLVLGHCLKMVTARAFITVACIVSVLGTIVLLIIGITGRNNPTLIILGKGLATGSLIFGVIGLAVGITWALHISGELAVPALFLSIVATTMNLASVGIVLAIPKLEV
jgi:hypothetical protein